MYCLLCKKVLFHRSKYHLKKLKNKRAENLFHNVEVTLGHNNNILVDKKIWILGITFSL